MWDAIVASIGAAESERMQAAGAPRPVAGGCIHESSVLALRGAAGGEARYFVKRNAEGFAAQFEAEAAGLEELRRPGVIRVPRPVCHGVAAGSAYLVLEFIPMGRAHPGSEERLGRRLAALHRITAGDGRFGWGRDNAIGATPQLNTPAPEWMEFFRDRRLRFQFRLAARNGHVLRDTEAVLEQAVPEILAHHPAVPSLLHGDLWGGNVGYDPEGDPVVFDPAVYFGDRETDLAFSRMFGGFGSGFYQAYEEAWPLPAGHARRAELYNLYHLVNHLNLFGGGYGAQAQACIRRLLRAA